MSKDVWKSQILTVIHSQTIDVSLAFSYGVMYNFIEIYNLEGDCLRIYLDNCCYNRPYDDQTQLRISLESQAKLHVQEMIKDGKLELAASYILTYENSKNRLKSSGKPSTSFLRIMFQFKSMSHIAGQLKRSLYPYNKPA